MSLELLSYELYDFDGGIAWAGGHAVYLDSFGICGTFSKLENDTQYYSIVQLDGYIASRGLSFYLQQTPAPDYDDINYYPIPDLSRDSIALLGSATYQNEAPFTRTYAFSEMTPLSGWKKYRNGAPIEVGGPFTHSIELPNLLPIGATADDFWFVGYGMPGDPWEQYSVVLVSFPRRLSRPQEFTVRATLGTTTLTSMVAAMSYGSLDTFWVSVRFDDVKDSISSRTYLYQYDFLRHTIVRRTEAVPPPAYDYPIYRIWYSKRFDVFVGMGQRGVYVFANEITPVTLTAPEIYDPYAQQALSITDTNPAVVGMSGDISVWAGVDSEGEAVPTFFEGLDGFFGRERRLDEGPDSRFTGRCRPGGLGNRSFTMQYDGTANFTLPYHGRDTLDTGVLMSGPKDGMPQGMDGSYRFFLGNSLSHLVSGDRVELYGFPAPYDILNGTLAEITYRASLYGSSGAVYLKFLDVPDYALPDGDVYGMCRQAPVDGRFKIGKMTVRTDNRRAGIARVELSNPMKFTVDSPTWLDDNRITDHRVRLQQVGLPESLNGIYRATRITPNQFSIPLDGIVGKMNSGIYSMSNGSPAVMQCDRVSLETGDVFKITSIPGMPSLDGVLADVGTVVTAPGYNGMRVNVTLALDTTSAGTQTGTGSGYLYASRNLATEAYAESLLAYEGIGFPLRVRATGTAGEPCVNLAVEWSSAPAGTFSKTVTKTDAEGWAVVMFYPETGTLGDHVITATVNWS